MEMFSYLLNNSSQILFLLKEHIQLTVIAVGLAIGVGVPLGIFISYVKAFSKPILGFTNLIQAVPSMALLGFAIPFLGIGTVPAIVVVFLYSLLPIVKNTYTGINQINPQIIEAARGIGMTRAQVLCKVQLPLTLPILMAGIRISAVTAVGLMTIAAFIGAGGLGFLVFSGISTINTAMILAGAIPACLLALAIDGILSLIEDLVTPMSLHPAQLKQKKKYMARRRIKKLAVSGLCICLLGIFGNNIYQQYQKPAHPIRIGSKQYSEQLILGNMLVDLIRANTDLKVESHLGTGGTEILFAAMNNGDIDAYVDYTGTLFVNVLKHKASSDAQTVYQQSAEELKEKYGITLLKQMPFNNTYTLAVPQSISTQYNLRTVSDLSQAAPSLHAGVTLEFLNRQDGLPGLAQAYGLSFGQVTGIDGANRYLALQNGEVQVVNAFMTDGLLKKFNLLTLEDDKHFFPPYYAVPLIRTEVLEEHPELADVINTLAPYLDNQTMQELNYQVDELHRSPEEVARQFLISKQLIPN